MSDLCESALPPLRCRNRGSLTISSVSQIIAAAQVGAHSEKRISYGHSVVVDPWGEVVAELGGEKKDEPEVIFADIDLGRVEAARNQIPLPRRTYV